MFRGIYGALVALGVFLSATPSWAQSSALENPQNGGNVSGVSLVSGWRCTGGTITARFDDSVTLAVPYGSDRADTLSTCGDTDNGFGLLVNWGLLGSGTHTVRLFDDGVEFAAATFEVTALGTEFLSGATASTLVPNFPSPGLTASLDWQEGQQSFVVTQFESLSPPASGSFSVSGSLTFNNCTNPANNVSYSYATTLSVAPDLFGFSGVTEFFTLGSDLEGRLRLEGTVYEIAEGVFISGIIGSNLTPIGGGEVTVLSGRFRSANPITDTPVNVSYSGSLRFPGEGGICLFEGSLTATRTM